MSIKSHLIGFTTAAVLTSGTILGIQYFWKSHHPKTAHANGTVKVSNVKIKNLSHVLEVYSTQGETTFTYLHDESWNFTKPKKDDGLAMEATRGLVCSFGCKYKEIGLYANYRLGAILYPDNLESIDQKTKTIRYHVSKVMMDFVPRFPGDSAETEEVKDANEKLSSISTDKKAKEKTTDDENVGIFRFDFSDHERSTILGDSVKEGKKQLAKDKPKIEKARKELADQLMEKIKKETGAKHVELVFDLEPTYLDMKKTKKTLHK